MAALPAAVDPLQGPLAVVPGQGAHQNVLPLIPFADIDNTISKWLVTSAQATAVTANARLLDELGTAYGRNDGMENLTPEQPVL